MYGWAGKMLDIDLSTGAIETRTLDMEIAKLFLGGQGLGARLLWDEVGPGTGNARRCEFQLNTPDRAKP